MILRRYQWLLGIIWLAIAGVLVFRHSLLPDAVLERINPANVTLLILMAIVFAGWNVARWYAFANRQRKMDNPLRSRNDAAKRGKKESNPEFDFDRERSSNAN